MRQIFMVKLFGIPKFTLRDNMSYLQTVKYILKMLFINKIHYLPLQYIYFTILKTFNINKKP